MIEPEPSSLAALLTQWIGDPQATRERGERGRCFVREQLAWARVAESMERLYSTVRDTPVTTADSTRAQLLW